MPSPGTRFPSRGAAFVALLYALGCVVLTWPLYRNPATAVLDTMSLYGAGGPLIQRDINLTLWVLAWDSHALITRPLRIFDANTFYPARWSLAFSEHMLGNVPWFTPVYLATGNPVLAHQITLLMTFVLAGLAMAVFVRYWTADDAAAVAAGFFFAFAPFRLWQIGSLHVVSIMYLPLVLLGIDATLDRRGGAGAPVLLAAALVLSSLCSYYIGYAAFVGAGVYLLAGLVARGRRAVGRLIAATTALATAALVVGLTTIPYLILQRSGAFADYGAKGTSLALVGLLRLGLGGLLGTFLLPGPAGVAEFLTFTAMALALVALWTRRRPPRGGLVLVGIAGVVLALGPYTILPGVPWPVPMPYRLLTRIVPGFSAMRVPQRFGALTALAVAALAGMGLAALRARLHDAGHRKIALLFPTLAVGLFLVEVAPHDLKPLPLPVGPAVPPVYRWLATHGDNGPLLELPASRMTQYSESLYMYYSTFHWLPLVNGYTGYPPRSYAEVMESVQQLPAPEALTSTLAKAGPRWILLHRNSLPLRVRSRYEMLLRSRLLLVGQFGDALLFEVPGWSPWEHAPPLVQPSADPHA